MNTILSIYAGAIMVLFVIVIMLLNAEREALTQRSRMARWLGPPIVGAFLVEILMVIWAQSAPFWRYTGSR